jgi:hypothetical protein
MTKMNKSKRAKNYLFCIALVFLSAVCNGQTLTGEETKLYNLIMRYRAEKGLPTIPVSPSLTYVAQTHVRDLEDNKPDIGNCNIHSWSNRGKWTACCYTGDHAQAQCMWNKSGELTSYKGNGYEIATGAQGYPMTAEKALSGWKSSSGHNAVIVEEGVWGNWNAIGVGLYRGYSVVWFGHEPDGNNAEITPSRSEAQPQSTSKPAAQIEEVRQEHNVRRDGHRNSIEIHVKFKVQGMLGKEGRVAVFFYDGNNNILKSGGGGSYRAPGGAITVQDTFNPGYENTTYNDFVLYIEYAEFGELYSYTGRHDVKLRVEIQYGQEGLAYSDFHGIEEYW